MIPGFTIHFRKMTSDIALINVLFLNHFDLESTKLLIIQPYLTSEHTDNSSKYNPATAAEIFSFSNAMIFIQKSPLIKGILKCS